MNQQPEEQIEIAVTTHYLADQSDSDAKRFVFAYEITIHNHFHRPVQLLGRRWVVTDGDEKVQEIEGEGVVGEQPTIEPEQSYRYTSGTVLSTHVGSMYGHYTMVTDQGETFEAQIAPFTLAQPNALH